MFVLVIGGYCLSISSISVLVSSDADDDFVFSKGSVFVMSFSVILVCSTGGLFLKPFALTGLGHRSFTVV